ncbi:MAG: glycine cleavage system protein GcvH [Gammaproteobacteria bacterium]|nr:MAG: glycine cleavage system protein GcvH [Gammaproteobacteria bacterium]RTZ61351.1 MAG: glycine cleavage system protein GcvH [Gammaproteobacteria bacterium]
MSTPENLKYLSSHEWVDDLGDGHVRIGITDHAQDALGDLVYVELPAVYYKFEKGDQAAVVESVKAASDIYAPVSGVVVAVNEALADEPEKINDDPYGEGWMIKLKLDNPDELDELLDAEAYQGVLSEED